MAGSLPDVTKIGQDKPFQDPQDAIRREQGTYDDAATKLTPDQRYQTGIMPAAPDPQPIGPSRGGTEG